MLQVYYLSTDTRLKVIKKVEYRKSPENWPKGITTGLTINLFNIYLFRGGKYCKREWKCNDKKHQCVSESIEMKRCIKFLSLSKFGP